MSTTSTKSTVSIIKGRMSDNKISTKPKISLREHIENLDFTNPYDPTEVLSKAEVEITEYKKNPTADKSFASETALFKALTLAEFSNGYMLALNFHESYRTMAIDLIRKMQKEYDCKTTSEKATVHIVVQNFLRMLSLQSDISKILNADSYNDMKLKRFELVSKELDRANRHYLASLQMLQSLKAPAFNVSIKANTAVVAQNQQINTTVSDSRKAPDEIINAI